MEVFCWVYPPPDSTTLTDVIRPLVKTGVITAPDPSPVTIKFGGELYFLPEFNTTTSIIFPLLITGAI
jgi:hypothetical protein